MANSSKSHITVKLISKEEAETVMKEPEIYERISDDNSPEAKDLVMPDMEYIGGFVDGKLVSVYLETQLVHFQVLKEYRKYADKLFKKSVKSGLKVIEIPVLYMSVINFAKKIGFEVESVIKFDYQKHRKHYDVYRLTLWVP